jgi:hypothetical protein
MAVEMRVRLPLALLLASVIALLTPWAYSDLPDQLWLGGFFDGGDEDDAIVHVQTHLNAIDPPDVHVAASLAQCASEPVQRYTSLPIQVLSPSTTRAPPAS